MSAWSVELEIRCDSSLLPKDAPDDLLQHLAALTPSVAVGDDGVAVRVSTEEPDHAAAMTTGTAAITEALRDLGLPTDPVVRAEAVTEAALDEQLGVANRPALVGVAEIAERLDVSRQRVSELARSRTFPPPVAELAAGPVWIEASLLRFIEGWERRPGRPRAGA